MRFIRFGSIVPPFLSPCYSSLHSCLCSLQLLMVQGSPRAASVPDGADSPRCPSTASCFRADVCCSLPHPRQNAPETPNPKQKHRFPSSALLPFLLTPQNAPGSSRLLPPAGKSARTRCRALEPKASDLGNPLPAPGPRRHAGLNDSGLELGCRLQTDSPLKFS